MKGSGERIMKQAKSVFNLMDEIRGEAKDVDVSCNLGDIDMTLMIPDNEDVEIPSHIAKQIGKKKLGIGILNSSHGAVYRAMTATKPRDTVTMIEDAVKAVKSDFSSTIIRDAVIHAEFIQDMITAHAQVEDAYPPYYGIGMGAMPMYSYQQMMIDSMSMLSIPEKEILSPRERKARYRQGLKSINGKKKKHYE